MNILNRVLVLFGLCAIALPTATAYSASTYETPVELPSCLVDSAEVMHIKTVADWDQINNKKKRIFCVHPGNYESAGAISLTTSGTAAKPRYIIYFNPKKQDPDLHPVKMIAAERAILRGFVFNGADNVVVDRISFKMTGKGELIKFPAGQDSDRNILNRVLIEGGGSGGGQVMLQGSLHNNNVIQNSVLRNTVKGRNQDYHCINLGDYPRATRIVNNEIYNCAGDSIQLKGGPGTVIDNNDMYLTSAMYSDCKGNLDPAGPCACAENALDIKGVTTTTADLPPKSEWLIISNNRMWGFKKTDVYCSGTGSEGDAIVLHWDPSDYILIKQNVIMDSYVGIGIAYKRPEEAGGTDHVSVVNNIFYRIRDNKKTGTVYVARGYRYEFYYNTIIDSDRYLYVSPASNRSDEAHENDYVCNVIVRSGLQVSNWPSSSRSDFNAYYASTPKTLVHDIEGSTPASSKNTPYIFMRRPYTSPQKTSIPYALASASSPHARLCEGLRVGDIKDIGVDNSIIRQAAAGATF